MKGISVLEIIVYRLTNKDTDTFSTVISVPIVGRVEEPMGAQATLDPD
jgi:hypothetical protein